MCQRPSTARECQALPTAYRRWAQVITDLLNPAATKLQIREDIKSGVYVEELSQEEVGTGTRRGLAGQHGGPPCNCHATGPLRPYL